MTNHHCLSTDAEMHSARVEFGADSAGATPTRFKVLSIEAKNASLDYSVLRLSGDASRFGRYHVGAPVAQKTDVLIIQHPDGRMKRAAFPPNCVVGSPQFVRGIAASVDFRHTCDTLGGSSGSPVLDWADLAGGRSASLDVLERRGRVSEPGRAHQVHRRRSEGAGPAEECEGRRRGRTAASKESVVKFLVACLPLLLAACSRPAEKPPTGTDSQPAAPASAGSQPSDGGLLVLLPEELARQESSSIPNMVVEQNHYALARKDDDLSWSLTGSVVNRAESSIAATPPKPTATLRGVSVYVSENEGIKTATWIEKGTAFALDLECASAVDPRCTSSTYILDRVRQLVERQPR